MKTKTMKRSDSIYVCMYVCDIVYVVNNNNNLTRL